jgi:hypothetical protein
MHLNPKGIKVQYRYWISLELLLFLLHFLVQPGLLGKQFFFSLNHVRIGHAAVYRAYSRTLGLFMKTGTLSTLTGYDIVKFIGYGRLRIFRID